MNKNILCVTAFALGVASLSIMSCGMPSGVDYSGSKLTRFEQSIALELPYYRGASDTSWTDPPYTSMAAGDRLVFLLDRERHEIIVYTDEGARAGTVAVTGLPAPDGPTAIAYDAGKLYAVSPSGKVVSATRGTDATAWTFGSPKQIAIPLDTLLNDGSTMNYKIGGIWKNPDGGWLVWGYYCETSQKFCAMDDSLKIDAASFRGANTVNEIVIAGIRGEMVRTFGWDRLAGWNMREYSGYGKGGVARTVSLPPVKDELIVAGCAYGTEYWYIARNRLSATNKPKLYHFISEYVEY